MIGNQNVKFCTDYFATSFPGILDILIKKAFFTLYKKVRSPGDEVDYIVLNFYHARGHTYYFHTHNF